MPIAEYREPLSCNNIDPLGAGSNRILASFKQKPYKLPHNRIAILAASDALQNSIPQRKRYFPDAIRVATSFMATLIRTPRSARCMLTHSGVPDEFLHAQRPLPR